MSEKKDKIIIAMAADLSSSCSSDSLNSTNSDIFNDETNSSDEFDISFSNEEDEENDILFSLYKFLMHGKRRSKVQGFLNTGHLYSDAIFKKHFRLQRHTAYLQIDILNIIIVFEFYLHSV